MLFTGTIRRKLVLGLALVLCMLLIVSFSGIYGLSSYRNVIHEFDYGLNEAPQPAVLVQAIARLFEPLLLRVRYHDEAGAKYQQEQFRERLAGAQSVLLEFRRRIDDLPPVLVPAGQLPVTDAFLRDLDAGLMRLQGLQEHLTTHGMREEALKQIKEETQRLLTVALQVPDPVEGLQGTVDRARNVYRSTLVAVCVTSVLALLLFFGMWRYGYLWIFDPIRKLHQGARRVANGDFDYRVQLNSRDEMAELAGAFNQMTARFQEIATDLDRQVQDRSRQLVRSERLAGVGFLAAGVAHEINNPLSAIAMAGESLEGRLIEVLDRLEPAEADVIRQYVQMIQSESFRCKQITERLLDFSRGRESKRESTDVTHLISEVIAMVQYLSKYREKKIEFQRTEPCYAEVNGPEIKQVVLNLVANALDAMDRGGTLKISLTEQTDRLMIDFTDDGCGMPPEVLETMFEPFFTTKQAGQGTGLGLSISHRIIHQHGGTLSASSPGPGKGSTFSVRLPRRAAAQTAAA